MQKIKILPKSLISKIAAGEVIHSPVNIIKELLENSLDASATEIIIEIKSGGRDYIRVYDNGVGMSEDDLKTSYLQHATSKVHTDHDLVNIHTFGFRGEALHSICSVSHVEMQSISEESDVAYFIKIDNNALVDEGICTLEKGTAIVVTDLFANLPARKKFLKSASYELSLITKLLQSYALAYTDVHIQLFSDDKLVLNLPPAETLITRCEKLFGNYTSTKLYDFIANNTHANIHGLLGSPQISTVSADNQYIFINKRLVKSTTITKLIRDLYGNIIFNTEQPFFILFIDISPADIDVNIHPQKETVNLAHETEVFDLLRDAISTALMAITKQQELYLDTDIYGNPKSDYIFNKLKSVTNPWSLKSIDKKNIIQLFNTYLIVPTDDGAFIIDQHAAHESILYSQFLNSFAQYKSEESIKLETPLILEYSVSEVSAILTNLQKVEACGFVIEEFGNNTFKIVNMPEFYKDHNVKKLLLELISTNESVDDLSKRTLAYLACRTAIKAGEVLSEDEASNLVEKLSTDNMYYTCPHGRPVSIFIDKSTFDKMFKRGH